MCGARTALHESVNRIQVPVRLIHQTSTAQATRGVQMDPRSAGAPFLEAPRARVLFERNFDLMSFDLLGLAEPVTRALAEEGYSQPTPIQAAAIPPALIGRDLVGIAQTGTGKTAAFALPILHRLAGDPKPRQPKSCRVLVLAPTRELGNQIVEFLRGLRPSRARLGDAGHRRRADRQTDPRAVARRRRAGGDARPAARPSQQPRGEFRRCRSARAGRSRPHARHGLHPRYPPHRRPAAQGTADAVLLRHHGAGDSQARRPDAERAGHGRGDAAGDDGRQGRPARHPGREGRQAGHARHAA